MEFKCYSPPKSLLTITTFIYLWLLSCYSRKWEDWLKYLLPDPLQKKLATLVLKKNLKTKSGQVHNLRHKICFCACIWPHFIWNIYAYENM